jgi:hypothetical protein
MPELECRVDAASTASRSWRRNPAKPLMGGGAVRSAWRINLLFEERDLLFQGV